MYRILIKVPREYYNDSTIEPYIIIKAAQVINNKVGQIAISNNHNDIVGYNDDIDSSEQFNDLKVIYEHISVVVTSLE